MSAQIAELAVPYAILALHDDGIEITADNIMKMLEAAGIEVEPIWATVFAKAFAGKDIGEFLMNVSAGAGSAAAAPVAAVAAATQEAPKAAAGGKKEEKKPAKEESEDEELGMGLFD